jgi:putative oxidoreductase
MLPDQRRTCARISFANAEVIRHELLSDGICSVLVLIGLATRPASAVILTNLLEAFFLVHHAAFLSDGHVELVAIYMTVFTTLVFTGPGRFSVDSHL